MIFIKNIYVPARNPISKSSSVIFLFFFVFQLKYSSQKGQKRYIRKQAIAIFNKNEIRSTKIGMYEKIPRKYKRKKKSTTKDKSLKRTNSLSFSFEPAFLNKDKI